MKYIAILEDEHIVRIGDKPCLHCFNGQMYDYFIPVKERKKGKWEYSGSYDVEGMLYCSCCKHEIDVSEGYFKFCPNCGAEMEGEDV